MRARRRRRHHLGACGVAIAGIAVGVVVLGGMADVLASTVPRSELVFARQGDTAMLVASQWSGSGACVGYFVKAGKELTGTAYLESSSGGAAQLVLHMHSTSDSFTFTGSVSQATGEDLTLAVRSSFKGRVYTASVTGTGSRFVGPLTASANGCTVTATGTFTLGGAGLSETTATTTTISTANLVDLGGLNVAGYCEQTTGTADTLTKGAVTGPGYAYGNWACGNGKPLSLQTLCNAAYGSEATGIVAVATNPDSAYSWTCYAQALSGTSTTVVPVTSAPSTRHLRTNPGVAPIAASIGTPGEVFHSFGHDLAMALVTVGVMLFIAFPANIFNHTFQENYEEILEMLANARRRVRRAFGFGEEPPGGVDAAAVATKDGPRPTSPAWFLGTLVIGAILGGLLKPGFGLNMSSLEDFLAALFAFAFGATVSFFIARAFRRHHRFVHHTYLKALPLGIAIAAACVVVSRLSDFSPGYLYGIVVSIAWVEELSDRHNAHLTTISALSTLGVAIAAWLLWIPANHLALEPSSNALEILIDDTLGSIFIGGLVGTVVNLLPLSGLPGGTIVGWRRDVWAAVCFVALFLLIEVELAPASGPTHPGGAPVFTAVLLFVLFGGLSLGLRAFFERRHREAAAPAATPDVVGPPAELPAD